MAERRSEISCLPLAQSQPDRHPTTVTQPDFTLPIATVSADLAPGRTIQTVAYNGSVPWPVLRMQEGKPVTIDIFDDTEVPELDALAGGCRRTHPTRDPDRAIGMGVVVQYADRKGEPQWRAPENSTWDYSVFGNSPGTSLRTQAKHPVPDGKFDLTFKMLADEGKPFNRWTVHGKLWPAVDPITVHRGKRYRLAFHNGMEEGHPIHLHRHSFEIVSIAGKPTSDIVKDTVNLPRDTTEVDFVADNPGRSLLYCHMQQHMDFGFKTIVKYA